MTSLIDIGKLSEPLTKMVEVVAAGIGEIYSPFGTVRRAKADRKALVIKAIAEEDSLAARAKARLEWTEELRQENIESVVSIAAGQLPEDVSSEAVDPDWTRQFFNAAQDVSDDDMRKLWGKILAGEVSKPGRFSKRTVEFLRTFDKFEAENYEKFCGYLFNNDSWLTILQVSATREAMLRQMGREDWLTHFMSIGLVSSEAGMIKASSFTGRRISYFENQYVFDGPEPPQATGKFGPLELHGTTLRLTQIGQQLAKIAEAKPVPDFVDAISKDMQDNLKVSLVRV